VTSVPVVDPALDLPSIPESWRYSALGDLLEPNGLSYGIVQPGSEDCDGIPILRVKNLHNGEVQTNDILRVSQDVEKQYRRSRLIGGEVLLSLVGSVGAVAIAPPSVAGWNVARAIGVLRVIGDTNHWIKYYLSSDFAQHCVRIWQNTTVQATLNLRDVRRLPIAVPPAQERAAIIAVLRALDDKIAVNDQIARTSRKLAMPQLEAAAQDGPALECKLSSIAALITRGVAPRYSEDAEELLVLNQKCVRDGRVSLGPSRRTTGEKVPDHKLLQRNDVLVNSTGVGTLGRVALWGSDDVVTVDSHVTIVRVDSDKADPLCAGLAILSEQRSIEALGEGSTGQTELGRAQLGALSLIIPDGYNARRLRPILDALEARGNAAVQESSALGALRDTLLPRLTSGEIRVRDVERIAGDAT
jgi:type I restriction enzyme, S subunit